MAVDDGDVGSCCVRGGKSRCESLAISDLAAGEHDECAKPNHQRGQSHEIFYNLSGYSVKPICTTHIAEVSMNTWHCCQPEMFPMLIADSI
jgi:hypothetical protein